MPRTAATEAKPVRLPMSPALLLYVVVPLVVLALPLALFRVRLGSEASLVLSLYFWSATVLVGWLAGALGSAILYRLCARLRPPLWVIVILGPILMGLVLHAPFAEILSLTPVLEAGAPFRSAPPSMTLSWAFLGKFLLNLAPGTITWAAANYVYDRILGIPRYRYPQAAEPSADMVAQAATDSVAEASAAAALPPLIERLPLASRGELVALRADDHYVRIYTDLGETMTLARLCDTIEMARPVSGMQVHRSSWVADRAIRDFRRTGHSGILYLSTGLEVPVSRSYCRQVERRVKSLAGD